MKKTIKLFFFLSLITLSSCRKKSSCEKKAEKLKKSTQYSKRSSSHNQ